MRGDPHQRHAYDTWNRLLDTAPDTIASQLLTDSAQGAFLRETAPAFDEITAEQARLPWAPPPR